MAFIDVADLKTQLNMTSSSNDTELQQFVDAACQVVEDKCGPIEQRTIVGEVADMTCDGIVLGNAPVIALTAATYQLGGSVYDTSVLTVNQATGIAARTDGQHLGLGSQRLLVSYTAGYATPPAWAVLAAKIIGAHLWRTQRGPKSNSTTDDPAAGSAYAIPNRALELMEDHLNLPGFA